MNDAGELLKISMIAVNRIQNAQQYLRQAWQAV
jgi:hypothetical protein